MSLTDSNSLHPDWESMDIGKFSQSFYNSDGLPLNEQIRLLKVKAINKAYRQRDLESLVTYSRSTDGLVTNQIRLKVWPLLLGITNDCDDKMISKFDSSQETRSAISSLEGNSSKLVTDSPHMNNLLDNLTTIDLPEHRDEEQVKLDINRSSTILSHLQTLQVNESYAEIHSNSDIEELKKKLQTLIIKILRKYPCLNYYQGYHDIASIVLIICHDLETNKAPFNEELAFLILEKLTILHLRDYMISDITLSVNHLSLIPYIMQTADPEIFHILQHTSNTDFKYDYKFYQGLSSILTVFSHDVSNIKEIFIIWDFMLSYNSILTNVYFYTATLIYYKSRIFQKLKIDKLGSVSEIAKVEIDKDLLHSLLSPTSLYQDLNEENLIKILNITTKLIEDYPLDEIDKKIKKDTFDIWFGKFNKHSVVVSTSKICKSYEERNSQISKFEILFNKDTLFEWIKAQDDEISQQNLYYIELFEQSALNDSLINDSASEKSGSLSLATSISSLASSTSAINTKLASTSLMISNIFFPEIDTDKCPKKKKLIFSNIYKFSLTIGFIGVLIHILFIRPNYKISNINFSKFLSKFTEETVRMSCKITYEIGEFINSMLAEHDLHRTNGYLGQVGLGNIRNNIYGFA